MRNEEVLCMFKVERNILDTINRRKANWICYDLHRNCLLEHDVEGKIGGRIEVTGRRERRYKLLWMTLKKRNVAGNYTTSHSVENSLWKRLWTCR